MAKKLTKKALPKGYGICLYCVRKQEEEEKGEESEQEGAEEQQQQEEKTEEQQQREIEPVKLIYSDLLKVSICRPCFSDVQTITKTTARERYLLTEKEVGSACIFFLLSRKRVKSICMAARLVKAPSSFVSLAAGHGDTTHSKE